MNPLYRLRQNRFSRWILTHLDPMIAVTLAHVEFRVCMNLFRHSGYVFKSKKVESNMHSLFMRACSNFRVFNFIDVGGNIGYYSWIAKSCQPDSKVTLIEPDPGNLKCVNATIRSNNIRNIEVVSKAASDRTGTVSFKVDSLSGQTSSIIDSFPNSDEVLYGIDRAKSIIVECITLDSLPQAAGVDCIKIDVEGAEIQVLSGAINCITVKRPVILVEVMLDNIERVLKFSADLGYSAYDICDPQIGPCVNLLLSPQSFDWVDQSVKDGLIALRS